MIDARSPASGLPVARDVVFSFAYATWRTAVARGMCFSEDRLVQTLADHPSVQRLLVVETPRSLPIKLVKDRLEPPPAFFSDERVSLYGPTRLRRSEPAGINATLRSLRAWDARVLREVQRRGLEAPALITCHPLVAGFAPLEWASSITFYAYDDLAAWPQMRRLWPAFREAYRRIREREIAVAAVSEKILDRVGTTGRSALVPNGVDPSEWSVIGNPPNWFEGLPGPRLLYVGSLETRIDVGALRDLAKALPDASIVLAGPLLDPSHFKPLSNEANVHIRPPVSRSELVGLVGAADVCLIPHIRNPLTEAMSPLKLFEYLAGAPPSRHWTFQRLGASLTAWSYARTFVLPSSRHSAWEGLLKRIASPSSRRTPGPNGMRRCSHWPWGRSDAAAVLEVPPPPARLPC